MDAAIVDCCKTPRQLSFAILGGALDDPQAVAAGALYWRTSAAYEASCAPGGKIRRRRPDFLGFLDRHDRDYAPRNDIALAELLDAGSRALVRDAIEHGCVLELEREPDLAPDAESPDAFRFISPVALVCMGTYGGKSVHQASCLMYRIGGFIDIRYDETKSAYSYPSDCARRCCPPAEAWRVFRSTK